MKNNFVMETSNNSNFISQERERIDSVNISDLEGQYQTTTNLNLPLKGILKKSDLDDLSNNDELSIILMKICFTIFIIIITVPIIIADLYFGFTDKSCVKDEPKNLAISMNLYLIVSGFINLGSMFILIINICCIPINIDLHIINLCCLFYTSFVLYTVVIFNTVWNILGAIIFWGSIYNEGNCNKNVSTYIFISLIIKFIRNLFIIIEEKSKRKQ